MKSLLENIVKAIREHKARTGVVSLVLIAALLGIQISPVYVERNSSSSFTIGYGKTAQQFVITIGMDVLAAGTADYTCDGVDDDIQFQQALNALPSGGGKISVLAGNYSFGATVTRVIGNVTIEGVGQATRFAYNGASPVFTAGGNNWVFRDMVVDSATSISMGATTSWEWANVYDQSTLWNSRVQSGQVVFATANITNLNMTGNIIPSVNTTHNLGSTLFRWLNGWFTNLFVGTANITTLNAPTGRGATYVIAASDAPAHVKTQSDVSLTAGQDLGAIVNTAIALGYKAISLSEGTFVYSTTSNLSVDKTSLTGQGTNTILTPLVSANIDAITVSALDVHLADFSINGDKTNHASGNGITLVSGGSRTTIEDITITYIKEAGIYKMPGALETFLANISVVYSGTGLHAQGSGGLAGANLWMTYNDNEGMWFDGAQWVNISTFRADGNTGNGITITPAVAGYDTNYVYLQNGDLDANYGHGIELRLPNGTTKSLLNIQIGSVQFADNGYGTNNTYDDVFYSRLGGTGTLARLDILNSQFTNPSGNLNRYRINLGSATGINVVHITGNTLTVAGASGTVNISSTIPNLMANQNIGWVYETNRLNGILYSNNITENAIPFGTTNQYLNGTGNFTTPVPNIFQFYPPFLKETAAVFISSYVNNSTRAFDASGNGNTGTLIGTPVSWTLNTTWGIWTNYFSGGSSSISISDSTSLRVNDFTVLTWMLPVQGSYSGLASKGNTISNNYGFVWELTNDNKMRTYVGNGTANDALSGTTVIPASGWFMGSISFNNTSRNVTQYINGIQSESKILSVNIAHTSDIVKFGQSTNNYAGYQTMQVILNRALTSTELFNIYEYTKGWFGY